MIRVILSLLVMLTAATGNMFGKGEGKAYLEKGDSVARIPKTLRKLPAYAFADFKNLKRVIFESPSQCVSIGDYAFLGCENLEAIVCCIYMRRQSGF